MGEKILLLIVFAKCNVDDMYLRMWKQQRNDGGAIFYDWSCKIYLPLGKYDSGEIDDINNFYEGLGMQNIDKFPFINVDTVCNALMCGLMVFESVAKEHKLNESDYAFATKIENAGETIMCFGGEKYKDYVRKYGLSYASKEINKSRIYYLKEHKNVKFSTMVGSIVNDFIGQHMLKVM